MFGKRIKETGIACKTSAGSACFYFYRKNFDDVMEWKSHEWERKKFVRNL